MDRNSIIGIILIVAILLGYQVYTSPSAEERARAQLVQDSLANAQIAEQARQAELAAQQQRLQVDTTTTLAAAPDTGFNADSLRQARLAGRFGLFSAAAEGTNEVITLENGKLEIGINTFGARPGVIRLKEYTTYDKTPLLLADPDSGDFEYSFFLGNLKISTRDLHFKAEKLGSTGVRLIAPTNDPGKRLAITYKLDSVDWFVDVTAELIGLSEVDPRNVMFHWNLLGPATEKHLDGQRQKSTVYYKYMTEDRNYLSESSADSIKLETRTNWVAFKQDFFTVAMVHPTGFAANGSEIAVDLTTDPRHTKRYDAKLFFDQAPGGTVLLPMKLYLGPNHYNTLRRTEIPQFDKIIDLGWGIFGWMNRWLVIPIFNFFGQFNLSYGIIILLLTVAIKLLLMPIAYRNQKSSARMKALRPEIEAINKKFPAEEALKRQQANMDLYRKAGVSPAAGCVPMLLQIPVLYAMFRFFPSSIELRQQPFLWADDLSSYDSIATLPFNIPAYGTHVSLFTLLMAASTIIYTVINSKQMPQQQSMPGMKTMMYIFPVMMLFFMNSLPAGLSYYYLLANLISILQ
ncbi:MAG TPA: membrane protein insertase YidC, partial [Flavobacteriales bacterium]